MKIKVRELRPSDMQSFADLSATREQLSPQQAEARAELVEWVAFRNPVKDGNPHYFVCVAGDRVVGHLGRMPTLFQIAGTHEMASYFHDLYVHPELRHEGAQGFFLSMKLYRSCEKASKSFSAMIWTNQINISLQRARKYQQMWTDERVMILGIKHKVESRAKGISARPIAHAARSAIRAAMWVNGLRLPRGACVERINTFDSRFDTLADRARGHTGIAPRKSCDYLTWKYSERPQLSCAIYQLLDEAGELAGFTVVVDPDQSGCGAIAELMVVDNDRRGIHALLECAIGYLQHMGAERVEAVATNEVHSHALHSRLFRRIMRVPLFLANVNRSPHAQLLSSPRNWHMSLGDSEGPF